MFRTASLLIALVAAIVVAQTSAQAPKPPAAATTKPAPPKPPAPKPPASVRPVTRKPVATAKPLAPLSDDEKTIYALGLLLQGSIGQFDLSTAELDLVKRALTDAALNKPAIELNDWGPRIEPLARARRERVAVREKAASGAYLAKAAAETGAVRTPSGLVYQELAAGTGASPVATDVVRVHYRGTLVNGTEFDSSYKRNEAAEFSLGGVIGCWTEGLQKMKVGGKARLVCPSDLGYGDAGRPSIPGGAALVFEVELLEIVPGR